MTALTPLVTIGGSLDLNPIGEGYRQTDQVALFDRAQRRPFAGGAEGRHAAAAGREQCLRVRRETRQVDRCIFAQRGHQGRPDAADARRSGQPGSINCNDGLGFQRVSPSTGVFHVSVANGRQNVCLKGADLAGNPGPTIDFLIPQ